jgi:hypothetical protein
MKNLTDLAYRIDPVLWVREVFFPQGGGPNKHLAVLTWNPCDSL